MKYIIMLGDGMSDYPCAELSDKTPLEVANKPNMDYFAQHGLCGMVRTVPEGMKPGSDNANLSVMGYDPLKYYTGRSPLEAVSMGIDMAPGDVAYRCNLVTLSDADDYKDAIMIDYSSDEITTKESTILINDINDAIKTDKINLYPGVSYRHCLILKDAQTGAQLTAPHDISRKPIVDYLPQGENSELLEHLMRTSQAVLKDHPINQVRIRDGLNPATSAWFWGEGRKPALSSFEQKFSLRGAVISAVDLIKGIAICAGMSVIEVPGATGNIHTNFKGKAQAAIDALKTHDFVYIHVEAPDECGHRHEVDNKVRAIELIDEHILGKIRAELKEDYCLLITPDHSTPLALMTHTSDPVPFVLYRSNAPTQGVSSYSEKRCEQTGNFIEVGHTLMDKLING